MGWFSNPRFAFCRGIANHAWKFPPELSHEGKGIALTLHCMNCGARRKDRIASGTGALEGRSYTYAEGYLLDLQGAKRPPKDTLRKEGLGLFGEPALSPKVRKLTPRTRRGRAA